MMWMSAMHLQIQSLYTTCKVTNHYSFCQFQVMILFGGLEKLERNAKVNDLLFKDKPVQPPIPSKKADKEAS